MNYYYYGYYITAYLAKLANTPNSITYYDAAKWLNLNTAGRRAILLEAPGLRFSLNNLVSSFTVLPTLLGWDTHVSLHHVRSSSEIDQRRDFINRIIDFKSSGELKAHLKLFGISYFISGENERNFLVKIQLNS